MSTTIDQRVVEMRFDNQQFERNVSTTMSTLDKLKQKLNLSGAAKGLDSINTSAKNVNMSGLGSSVDSVSAKFSALQVMGVTALANITNSAVNAGKRIVSALTIDPIKTGFSEYETQINATQTILANTSHKGSTIDDVNRALEELNKYADMTIYNFTEMTRNIGTFTAAGIDLNTSVNAIQGIANLAAVSGSTSQQASTAMYQLSQALAAGTIRLMDWNSVVNAGMGGEIFQNALKETSEALGTGAEAAIKATGSFRESLREEWLTAEVLTETLKKFTTSGANEYVAEYTGLSIEAVEAAVKEGEAVAEAAKARGEEVDAIEHASKALAAKSGKNAKEIADTLQFAKTATDAATKVKTFSQLWDVLKESAQSGWSQTWKLIIGDFEEAKSLLTPLADFLTGIINKMSDWRNAILEKALDSPFGKLAEKLGKVTGAVDTVTEAVKNYEEIADRIIGGEFGNGQARWDKLAETGYDWAKAQNIVNERLGSSVRHTEQLTDAQGKQAETQATTIEQLVKMNDAQLESLGFTKEEIKAFRELEEQSKKTGIPIEELAKDLDQLSGRNLLINSFKNIGKAIGEIFTTVKTAWQDIFPPKSIEERAVQLYDMIAALHKFTSNLGGLVDENGKLTESGDKLVRTFKGVFAILDIITTVAGGGLKIAFKVLTGILSHFNLDILDVTAAVGDAIVGFRDWVDSVLNVSGAIDVVVPVVKDAIKSVKDWFAVFKESPAVQKLVTAVENIVSAFNKLTSGKIDISEFAQQLGTNLATALKSLPEIAIQIGSDFIAGFVNGIGDGVSGVISNIVSIALDFVSSFAEALGVQSPSWKAHNIASDFFQGFINGAKEGVSAVVGVLKKVGEKIVQVFKSLWDTITDENGNIEWGKLFSGGILVSMVWFLKQIATAVSGIAGALGGLDDIFEETGKVIKKFGKVLNAYSWDLKASALQKLAISIAILVAAVVVLAQIDDVGKLWNAVGIIAVLAGILVGLAFAMDKLSQASVKVNKSGASLDGLKTGITQIGIALLLLAATVAIVGNMDPEKAKQGFIRLAGLAVGLIAFVAAIGGISRYSTDISKFSTFIMKLSLAMWSMVGVLKLVGGLSAEEMLQGALFVSAFTLFVAAIAKITKTSNSEINKLGGTMIKLTIAMGLMVGVVKLANMLSAEEMLKGAAFAGGFVLLVKALVWATKIGKDKDLAKVSGMVLSVSFSLTLMVGVCKLVGKLSVEEMLKGALFVTGFAVMLKAMVEILTIGNEQKMAKVTGTILAMSLAVGILAATAAALSYVPLGGLVKGVAAVGMLGLVMAGMIKALKGAQNVKGSLMMMTIAIGVMAAAVVALSFVPFEDLYGAVGGLGLLMGMFAMMTKSLSGLKNVKVGPLIVLTGVVAILAGIVYLLQDIDPKSAIGSAIALSTLLLAMSVALNILDKMTGTLGNSLKGILGLTLMAVPLLALVGVLELMSGVENATTNVKALTILATTLTLLLIPLTAIGAIATTGVGLAAVVLGIGALLLMTVPLLALVGILALMSGVENATANATLLIDMVKVLTDVLMQLSAVAPMAAIGVVAMAGLTLLIGAIGTMAVAIGALMDKFPSIQKFLDTGLPVLEQLAGSIGTMVGKFIGGIGEGISDSLVKIGDDIVLFMDKLKVASDSASGIKGEAFDGVKKLIGVMAGIGATTVGTTIADIFTLGGTSMEKFQKDGVAFFTAMKEIAKASEGVTMNAESVDAVIDVAKKLAGLQSSLEPIGGVVTWFTGRSDLGTFGTNVGLFIDAMKTALGSLGGFQIDQQTFDALIGAAQSLATLQSSLEPIGGVISWFTGRSDLGTFGTNVGLFISAMKTALSSLDGFAPNTEGMNAIISTAKELAGLQSVLEPIGGVISWFTGRDDLATFGTNVGTFISSMKTALATLEGTVLNQEAMTSVITAATELSKLQAKLEPMGGVISWFTGRSDLGTFGTNIGLFASAMGTLKTGMGENGISEEVVTSITNASNAIIELQKALPEEGWFDGKMNLSEFSGYVTEFGTAMGNFGTTAAGIDSAAVGLAVTTAQKIRNLIESLVGLDTSGLTTFTGIGTGGFGADGAAYKIGQALSAYSDEVTGIDTSAVSTSVSAATKLKSLIAGLVGLDASGIENFKVASIGSSMKSYSDKVAGIDAGLVSSSISAANRLKTFIVGLSGIDTSGIGNFKIASIGDAIKAYGTSVSGVNIGAIGKSISAATRIKNFISSLSGLSTSGISSFKSAVDELSTVNIGNLVKAFSGASTQLTTAGADMINGLVRGIQSKMTAVNGAVTKIITSSVQALRSKTPAFGTAGSTLITMLATGMSNKKGAVSSAVQSCISSAAASIRSRYTSFYSAGAYLVSGFAAGISDNTFRAEAKAKAMANAAEKAAKEALDINSPSKVFRAIGYSVPEGFAMGIDRLSGLVRNSTTDMADGAISSVRDSISKIANVINTDIDSQPTIRPVLDLSDVRSGAEVIGSLFDSRTSVGVMANVGAISSTMNARSQNGNNGDIIAAINKLGKDLAKTGGDSYQVNGVTYDDGSNIKGFAQAVIRQARIERRV